MGKSSLMYRAAEQLAQQGVVPTIIDLTELGAQTTADQWYKGFLLRVQEQLDLRESASAWWDAHQEYAFAQRLIRYLREVALVERPERLVLFVDEIDTTLRLDFTDDFFAAIRFLYQNRALDAELERISFVLIGVATPNDLIKDAARTPFNIGRRIELTDFTSAGSGGTCCSSRSATRHGRRLHRRDSPLDQWTSLPDDAGAPLAGRNAAAGVEHNRGRRACARAVPWSGRRGRHEPAVRP